MAVVVSSMRGQRGIRLQLAWRPPSQGGAHATQRYRDRSLWYWGNAECQRTAADRRRDGIPSRTSKPTDVDSCPRSEVFVSLMPCIEGTGSASVQSLEAASGFLARYLPVHDGYFWARRRSRSNEVVRRKQQCSKS